MGGSVNAPELSQVIHGNVATITTTFRNGVEASGYKSLIPPLIYIVISYFVLRMLGDLMLNAPSR